MGIPTLIKTLTASGSATLDFVDGTSSVVLDSTYDEYMFVLTDIHPSAAAGVLTFQVNLTNDAGGDYDNSSIQSTAFYVAHGEGDGVEGPSYKAGYDVPHSGNAEIFQPLHENVGGENDESCAGILHLFSPSSTTFVKHFYSRIHSYRSDNRADTTFISGYINHTTAVDEIRFKMSSGNIDAGVIQLYGIA